MVSNRYIESIQERYAGLLAIGWPQTQGGPRIHKHPIARSVPAAPGTRTAWLCVASSRF